jgi:signal transduction histidine kinase
MQAKGWLDAAPFCFYGTFGMKPLGIRYRILLATLAPATLVAFLVSSLLIVDQIEQARTEQHRRLAAVARQIASAAEYNIFVGNSAGLLALLEITTREPDLIGAAILDAHGKVLASTVPISALPPHEAVHHGMSPPSDPSSSRHWHRIAISASNFGEQDLFAGAAAPASPELGQLLLEVTDEPLQREIRHDLFSAVALSLVVLLFGSLLALALSRNLIRLLLRISRVVDQVGHGIGSARIGHAGPDELGQLAEGIDRMIGRVEINQAELAARIAAATLALRREKEEAEEAGLSRSRFFAAASHDLRQPVQALGLFVAQLEREARHGPLQTRVSQLAQSVRNLQALLDTLLDYSRLDGKVFRTDLRPVNARTAITAVAAEFSAAAAAKGLMLRCRACDCWLLTDPALLHRILLNLVSNSIRHTRQGGILIGCRRGMSHARISVWDTGPGIPAEHHATIFDELVQLENPERDAGKGLGLGLAIVRRTADLLHHPLMLRSHLSRGSCFSVMIPLTEAPAIPDPVPALDEPARGPILVLGAPTADRDELTTLLNGWGLPSLAVADADQALERMEADGIPSLLLCESGGRLDPLLDALDRLDAVAGTPVPALLVHPGPVTGIDLRGERRLLLARPYRPARLRALLSHLLEPEGAAE